ncbi:uncharacterized protein [Diabrotica undecimpunctata]|uniref:uncharacterized protein isoform X2 n=1 Tax=Diabrotica undecimpunctata TaxID=50387 RepID=UPI003B63A286
MVFHNKCCIVQCTNSSTIRHSFPNPDKEIIRFRKWLSVIKNPDLDIMNSTTVFKTKRICRRHFEDKFVSSWSHRLYPTAIPSLHMHDDSSSNVHSRSISRLCAETNVTEIESPSTSRDAQSSHMFQSYEIPYCIAEHNYAKLPNEEILIVQTDKSKDLKDGFN